jgi:hypothetical protein
MPSGATGPDECGDPGIPGPVGPPPTGWARGLRGLAAAQPGSAVVVAFCGGQGGDAGGAPRRMFGPAPLPRRRWEHTRGGRSRGRGDGRCAARHRERRFGVDAIGVVARGDGQLGGGDGRDPPGLHQGLVPGGGPAHEVGVVAGNLLVEPLVPGRAVPHGRPGVPRRRRCRSLRWPWHWRPMPGARGQASIRLDWPCLRRTRRAGRITSRTSRPVRCRCRIGPAPARAGFPWARTRKGAPWPGPGLAGVPGTGFQHVSQLLKPASDQHR